MSKDVKPWDLLNPSNYHNIEELSEQRFSICLSCEHLRAIPKTCKKCGCFMKAKVKLEKATCPIGKW